MSSGIDECISLIEEGKWDRALEKLSALIHDKPLDRAAHEGLMKIYSLKGNLTMLEEELMRYIVALSASSQIPLIGEKLRELVTLARDKEETLKRLISVFKMRGLYEEFYRASLLLVRFYLDSKDQRRAVALLKVLREAGPEDPAIRIEMGLLYGRMGDSLNSLIILKEALWDTLRKNLPEWTERAVHAIEEVTGDDASGLFALAEAYEQLDNMELAAEQYTKLLKVNRDNYHALLAVGKNMFATERYELAARTFSRIVRVFPEEIDALKGLGGVFEQQGRISEAVLCYLRASRAGLRQKKRKEATMLLKQVVKLEPDNEVAKRTLEKISAGALFGRRSAEESLLTITVDQEPREPGAAVKPAAPRLLPGKIKSRQDAPPSPAPTALSKEARKFLESTVINLRFNVKELSLSLITLQGAVSWAFDSNVTFPFTPAKLVRIGKFFGTHRLIREGSLKFIMLGSSRWNHFFAILPRDAYILMVVPETADFGVIYSWLVYIHERLAKMTVLE